MPIQFRCPSCRKMLSISSRRAGSAIVCPACTEEILVPKVDGAPATPAPEASGANPGASASSPSSAAGPNEKATSVRRGAFDESGVRSRHSLFDDEQHDDRDEEHDEDEVPHPKKKRFMDDTIDMTAMVDVTFLLLIFFMVTASFAAQKVFETSPPEQEESETASGGGEGGGGSVTVEDVENASVIVEIDAADQLKIDETPVSGLFELRELLAKKISDESKTEVLIQAEYAATHGMVVQVTDAAMDVGMQKVRRASRKSDD